MPISPRSAPKLRVRMLVALTVLLLLMLLSMPLDAMSAAAAKPDGSTSAPNVLRPEEAPSATAAEAGEEEEEGQEEEEEEETEAEEEQEEEEELEEAEEAEEEYEAEEEAEALASAGRNGRRRGGRAVHVSKLALTRSGKSALKHGHPSASRVSFTFKLSAKCNVRFQLAREQHHGVVSTWHPMSTISLTAKRGSDKGHLYDGGRLSAGEYKLTLTPAGGRAATLQFEVR